MARGDHIKVWRSFYWHHGIDCGDGTVVHLSGEPTRPFDAVVRRIPREEFLRGGQARVVRHRQTLTVESAMARALGCLGQGGYSIVWNNCEHFARWCVAGRHESKQVRSAINGSVALGAAGTVFTMLARRQGLMAVGAVAPVLAPLSAVLLVAGALSSLLGDLYGVPFAEPDDPGSAA
jgi:hypothetical protein